MTLHIEQDNVKMTSILIIDDSAWIAKTIKKVLESGGYQVVDIARDGLEGVDFYAKYRPDVVLLDITMPNMDGRECLENIMEFDRGARIIMVSAIKERTVVNECIARGARDFIQKPIDVRNEQRLAQLFETIDKAAAGA